MKNGVRAHYDGKRVVLDEPATFRPGADLLVVERSPSPPLQGQELLEKLAREQGVSLRVDLDGLMTDAPPGRGRE